MRCNEIVVLTVENADNIKVSMGAGGRRKREMLAPCGVQAKQSVTQQHGTMWHMLEHPCHAQCRRKMREYRNYVPVRKSTYDWRLSHKQYTVYLG